MINRTTLKFGLPKDFQAGLKGESKPLKECYQTLAVSDSFHKKALKRFEKVINDPKAFKVDMDEKVCLSNFLSL
jgi:hypothetical protein